METATSLSFFNSIQILSKSEWIITSKCLFGFSVYFTLNTRQSISNPFNLFGEIYVWGWIFKTLPKSLATLILTRKKQKCSRISNNESMLIKSHLFHVVSLKLLCFIRCVRRRKSCRDFSYLTFRISIKVKMSASNESDGSRLSVMTRNCQKQLSFLRDFCLDWCETRHSDEKTN